MVTKLWGEGDLGHPLTEAIGLVRDPETFSVGLVKVLKKRNGKKMCWPLLLRRKPYDLEQ